MCIFADTNQNAMGITVGLLIPLLGTMLGAAFVIFMKKDMSPMPLQANIPTSALLVLPLDLC